VCTIFNMVQ